MPCKSDLKYLWVYLDRKSSDRTRVWLFLTLRDVDKLILLLLKRPIVSISMLTSHF